MTRCAERIVRTAPTPQAASSSLRTPEAVWSRGSGFPTTLQAKLEVARSDDPLEREADRVAERVLGEERPDAPTGPIRVQRACAECDEEEPDGAPPDVPRVLHAEGQPLDRATRGFFEPRFGRDFSRVRVHTDATAANSARSLNALAYTVGQDVVFAAGRYAPHTSNGRRLLAHELAHVLQQTDAPGAHSKLQRQADITQAPSGLPCVLTTGPGHPSGTNVLFEVSSSLLSETARRDIAAFVASWTGSNDDILVDGWASVDGTQDVNWRLSCERAEAVKTELVGLGVPAAKVTTLAHGESSEFSTSNRPRNRRAVISRQRAVPPAPSPPGPAPAPAPAPRPAPAPAVAVTITGGTELWWFDGQTPSLYPVRQALTASSGGLPGTFNWSIVRGGGFVNYGVGAPPLGSPTATGPNADLQSIAPSAALADVEIRVDFAGTAGGAGSALRSFTVRAPNSTRFIRNDDHNHPGFVYETRIHKAPQDQFATDLPRGIEINEQFTAAPTADFPGMDWRRGNPGGGFIRPPDWHYDTIQGETPSHTPTPVPPADANAGVAVYHWPGIWRLGTGTVGVGRSIETITWQKFRGRARHT